MVQRSIQTVLREAFQQPTVVADQHNPRMHPGQLAFQPLDSGEVEMVGGLVKQQDVGRRGEHAGQRGAAGLAAG